MADKTNEIRFRALLNQLTVMPKGVNPLNIPPRFQFIVARANGIASTWEHFPPDDLSVGLDTAAAIARLTLSLLRERENLYRQLAEMGVEPKRLKDSVDTLPMEELVRTLKSSGNK